MDPAVTPVVELAEPDQVSCRLHPRSNICWITDAGIITLKPSEVHSVLKGELNVSMMEFQSS